VLDTSSLVSYVLTHGEIMRRVIGHWRANHYVSLSSPQTQAELTAILARPQIRRLATAPLDDLVQGIERYTWRVPGALTLRGACRDPKDDKFLACAVEGQAHYLVSSENDLLHMRSFRGVVIHNPGPFLLALELSMLGAAAMAQRFGRDMLVDIQMTLLLEPGTTNRLAAAVELAERVGIPGPASGERLS
jgi:putative PIN family toxin of toxin-antitoxin system